MFNVSPNPSISLPHLKLSPNFGRAKNQCQFLLQTKGAIVGRWRESLTRLRWHCQQPTCCCCSGTAEASRWSSSSLCRCRFLEELILIRGHRVRPGSSTVAGVRTRSPAEPSEGSGSAVEHRPSSFSHQGANREFSIARIRCPSSTRTVPRASPSHC